MTPNDEEDEISRRTNDSVSSSSLLPSPDAFSGSNVSTCASTPSRENDCGFVVEGEGEGTNSAQLTAASGQPPTEGIVFCANVVGGGTTIGGGSSTDREADGDGVSGDRDGWPIESDGEGESDAVTTCGSVRLALGVSDGSNVSVGMSRVAVGVGVGGGATEGVSGCVALSETVGRDMEALGVAVDTAVREKVAARVGAVADPDGAERDSDADGDAFVIARLSDADTRSVGVGPDGEVETETAFETDAVLDVLASSVAVGTALGEAEGSGLGVVDAVTVGAGLAEDVPVTLGEASGELEGVGPLGEAGRLWLMVAESEAVGIKVAVAETDWLGAAETESEAFGLAETVPEGGSDSEAVSKGEGLSETV